MNSYINLIGRLNNSVFDIFDLYEIINFCLKKKETTFIIKPSTQYKITKGINVISFSANTIKKNEDLIPNDL